MEKYRKYLPSEKFIKTGGAVLVLILVFLLILFFSSKEDIFSRGDKANKNSGIATAGDLFSQMVIRDTDGDSIPDWEEDLWGTDKTKKITFDNMPDATYIANKRKELNLENSVDEKNLTETEKFAREFFATYSAMKSSGEVEDDTINAFSATLGQGIVNPNLTDIYTPDKIKIGQNDTFEAKKKYFESLQRLYAGYLELGIGDELEILSANLSASSSGTGGSSDQIKKLNTIGNAYKDFSKDMLDLTVPASLSTYHLEIANSANNTGVSVLNMTRVINDPIVGLSGLSQYQQYSEALIQATEDLETALSS